MGKQTTPKPAHYPEKVRDMLLKNDEIPRFIEFTNNLEFSNKIIADYEFLQFVSAYKEFHEYVIAISYGATNIPLQPRMLLVEKASELAKDIRTMWESGFRLKALADKLGFYDEGSGENEQ